MVDPAKREAFRGVLQKMIDDGAPEETIREATEKFKAKYAAPPGAPFSGMGDVKMVEREGPQVATAPDSFGGMVRSIGRGIAHQFTPVAKFAGNVAQALSTGPVNAIIQGNQDDAGFIGTAKNVGRALVDPFVPGQSPIQQTSKSLERMGVPNQPREITERVPGFVYKAWAQSGQYGLTPKDAEGIADNQFVERTRAQPGRADELGFAADIASPLYAVGAAKMLGAGAKLAAKSKPAQAAMDAAGKGLEAVGADQMKRVIKPLMRHERKAKKPIEQIVFEYDLDKGPGGAGPKAIYERSQAKLNELGAKLKAEIKAGRDEGARVNTDKIINDAIADLKANPGESEDFYSMVNDLDEIGKDFRDRARAANEKGFGNLDLLQAHNFKKYLGHEGAWQQIAKSKGIPLTAKETARSKIAEDIYHRLNDAIDEAAPNGIRDLNRQISEIIPANQAAGWRQIVEGRGNNISLSDVVTMSATAINPKVWPVMVLNRASKSGTVASKIYRLGEKLRTAKTPVDKAYYELQLRNLGLTPEEIKAGTQMVESSGGPEAFKAQEIRIQDAPKETPPPNAVPWRPMEVKGSTGKMGSVQAHNRRMQATQYLQKTLGREPEQGEIYRFLEQHDGQPIPQAPQAPKQTREFKGRRTTQEIDLNISMLRSGNPEYPTKAMPVKDAPDTFTLNGETFKRVKGGYDNVFTWKDSKGRPHTFRSANETIHMDDPENPFQVTEKPPAEAPKDDFIGEDGQPLFQMETEGLGFKEYPIAKEIVDGRVIGEKVKNMGSIRASIDEPEILPGIREVNLSDFDADPKDMFYAADDHRRVKALAEEIKASGRIDPLIVVMDEKGPYVLEGGHRLAALHTLGAKSFPAVVVKDAKSIREAGKPLYQMDSKKPKLEDIRERWKKEGVEIDAYESKNGGINIPRIVVSKEKRNQGIGTKAMQDLIRHADETGQRITLSPSSDFGGNKAKLQEWYKRLGFVENKGRNKDFTTRETMLREPRETLYQMEGAKPPRELPKENHIVPLKQYAPKVYRETNPIRALDFLPGSRNDFMNRDEIHFAETPSMALGQADNRGIRLEFDTDNLDGVINLEKPGLDFAFRNRDGEFIGVGNSQDKYRNALRSLTITKDADQGKLGNQARFKTFGFRLEKSGWKKTKNPDGSITYTKPGAETGETLYQMDTPKKPTETPEFKKWFEGSKAVDETGAPRVMYHGTIQNFDTFQGKKYGPDQGAIFFTDDPKIAGAYARNDQVGPENIMPVSLSMKNPLEVQIGEYRDLPPLIAKAKAQGRDGVIARNMYDTGGKQNQYVVFRPEQVKSIHNRGTFDPNDPNILRQDERKLNSPKGQIQRRKDDQRATITLFKGKADVSTWMHEHAHWVRSGALPKEQADKALAAMGHKTWTREAEEQFARGWERYLYNGKAPSKELEPAFSTLKGRMREIYKDLKGTDLEADIPEEMKIIYDALLLRNKKPNPDRVKKALEAIRKADGGATPRLLAALRHAVNSEKEERKERDLPTLTLNDLVGRRSRPDSLLSQVMRSR